MSLTVRVATEEDLPAVLSLYAQPGFDEEVLPLDEARALLRRFAEYPNYRLFVALEDETVVGSFALLVMDNLGHCGSRSAIVEDVVVAPDAQGSGVGRAMMARALDEAQAAGAYKAMLSSNAKRDAAHAFYESLGFERHGYSFRIGLEGGQ